ncbi:MAG: transcription-repair coupling factor [Saprospiraceae bacterium]|nr:transcription-repair coupling factor [Saprospiraceae bacterium]
METLDYILDAFQKSKPLLEIQNLLQNENLLRAQVNGTVGAQDTFIISALFKANPAFHIYIANDKEQAAYVQNNLESILVNRPVWFLPDSFKKPSVFDELNNTNVLQRTEAINHMTSGLSKGEILVTYPEALFEKVVSPEVLNESRIEIAAGEILDLNFLIEILVEYGFERTDFVYEPGQFSIRGGIVDIFSFGNEWPYRVEMFDETVETIRLFDPMDQLSKRNIARVLIVPNINTKFSRDQKVSLFKVMSPNTTIWMQDYDFILDRLQFCFESASQFADQLSLVEDVVLKEILRDRVFVTPGELHSEINDFSIIQLNKSASAIPVRHTITFRGKPQPTFNKQFNLLIDDLKSNEKKGLHNFIFTDNARQIERFYSIFEDLNADISWKPVMISINQGFIDEDIKVACYTDHQIFQRYHTFRLRKRFSRELAMNLKLLRELQPGDFVTHIDHGVGRYSGLEKLDINGQIQEAVRLVYQNNDLLYVGINSLHKISKYVGKEGTEPKLHKLGSDAWKTLKSRTKKKVKDIAAELIKLYAKRRASKGFAFSPDGYLQNELEASFIYEDTPDQLKSTNDTKDDMMKPYPMDRLICGDVGFGKTEVAIRAAFKAVVDGKQVAVLVPTTILALQHFKTFNERLKEFGVRVDYVNRFRSIAEKKASFESAKEGKVDILIGTHAILNKELQFKDLGLLIIDEEQKFGVAAKERLRHFKINVDTLTLTATPIPRTLQFSLMAARDLSIMRTPPPNRQPIQTEVRVFNDDVVRDAIYYEVNRGGQVFFVHNRVKSLAEMAEMIKKICPDVSVVTVHGQMDPKALETTLVDFIEGKYDVLVCTNIIETGLDIPNVNTIIISNAHQFGLSDLHQLRGRVGRSNRKAFCYLFSPPLSVLTQEARKRLKTLEEFTELGSGFNIAMRDMDIRGAGNLLGGEQSGFISDVGYDTYQKILEEAITELKQTEYKDLFKEEIEKDRKYVTNIQIDTDNEMHIPDLYVTSIQERLSLYSELDGIETEEGITAFAEKLEDRFGPLPSQVLALFEGLRLRWIARRMAFERVLLKNRKLACYFVNNPQSPFFESEYFNQLMSFFATDGQRLGITLKNNNKILYLVKDGVRNIEQARNFLEMVHSRLEELALSQ